MNIESLGTQKRAQVLLRKSLCRWQGLLDLRSDTDHIGTDQSIRTNVAFKSANAWTLAFAILIASIGLNVNSAAVIIGAMLISPLMGPIVGIGYGLAINDFDLVKRAGTNLSIAVAISIVASSLFFIVSPISTAQSELLARTTPTFFDVMIAFFGGATGIVAASRTEKSQAIPGVAIATALMPPLCTVGFGISQLNLTYIAGAFYLFVINSVFICTATYIFVRVLRFGELSYDDQVRQSKVRRWLAWISLVLIVPSLILAWYLKAKTSFELRANNFVENELSFERSFVIDHEVEYRWEGWGLSERPRLYVRLGGEALTDTEIAQLKSRLKLYELSESQLELKQTTERSVFESLNPAQLRAAILQIPEIGRDLIQQGLGELARDFTKITEEAKAFLPHLHLIRVAATVDATSQLVHVQWERLPTLRDRESLEAFIRERMGASSQKLAIEHARRINN
jgi:uncharacterized hydrophobic protein (TIGR00271 family)